MLKSRHEIVPPNSPAIPLPTSPNSAVGPRAKTTYKMLIIRTFLAFAGRFLGAETSFSLLSGRTPSLWTRALAKGRNHTVEGARSRSAAARGSGSEAALATVLTASMPCLPRISISWLGKAERSSPARSTVSSETTSWQP